MSGLLKALRNIKATPSVRGLAEWYQDKMGYRRMGLRLDDMIPEENPMVQEALRRLSTKEQYDRQYRFRRALQASIRQEEVPKAEWVTQETDTPYLRPLVEQVEFEFAEKQAYNQMSAIPPAFLGKNKA